MGSVNRWLWLCRANLNASHLTMYARNKSSPGQSPNSLLESWTHNAWREEDQTNLPRTTSVFELRRSGNHVAELTWTCTSTSTYEVRRRRGWESTAYIYYLLSILVYCPSLTSAILPSCSKLGAPPKPADKVPFPASYCVHAFFSRALHHAPLNRIAAADIVHRSSILSAGGHAAQSHTVSVLAAGAVCTSELRRPSTLEKTSYSYSLYTTAHFRHQLSIFEPVN